VRTLFLGTSEYAVVVLERVAASDFRPALVIAPPDRRRGRGRRVSPPPVARAAGELGLELLQTESVNRQEAVDAVRVADPDVGLVCAFGQLIREPLLSELELLNVHPSLLPRWRGAAPIERAIMAGDAATGVTIMRVTEGLDSGPIALQESTPISDEENFGALAERLAGLGGELGVRALELRSAGELEFTPQDESAATYADKIAPHERLLDPRRPAAELARVVRALTPRVGAYLELDGDRLGVHAAQAEDGDLDAGKLDARDGALRLGCGEGVLRLCVVQPSGKRPMPAEAYLRGHPVPRLA
jgi:methionyl-tRNA formyltransferase